MEMETIYLAFANSRENKLPTLDKEDEGAFSILSPRMAEGHFMVVRDSYATSEKVQERLILFRNLIRVFLFSGHAGRDRLLLDDEGANALGIAKLLARCPNLKLVILNGCSTGGQVEKLLELGIPAVIGTSSPVSDKAATCFSIAFFQAFSEKRENINESFEAGLGAAQVVRTEKIEVAAGRGINLKGKNQEPLWGLFCAEDDENHLEWVLPTYSELDVDPFHPNEAIIEALTEALAPYNSILDEMLQQEKDGGDPSISDKQKAILESLPHPISEQLRKLFAPKDDNSQTVFFDKPGLDRLSQLTNTYITVIEFLSFIMLGQLWDAAIGEEMLKIDPEHYATIKTFFSLKKAQREIFDFVPLIRSIRLTLDANHISYFISELKDLQQSFNSDSTFQFACTYLETLKKDIVKKKVSQGEAMQLCKTAEEMLAEVLCEVGFFANYQLTSVKDVGVLKYRHTKVVKFKHKLVKLVQKFVKLDEQNQVFSQMLDTSSVILLKGGKREEGDLTFLNLSPFVIDENAFSQRARDDNKVSKLHFFEHYEPRRDSYYFKHVYKPTDRLLEVQKQKEYIILKQQFDFFSELIFQKPMNSI